MDGYESIPIAVLTDNQDDVELINSALRDAGHAAHCIWVTTPSTLDDTLEEKNVKLLIVNCDRYPDDIHLVVRQKNRIKPEVPLIATKEEVTEAEIQSAMSAGASDLVSLGLRSRLQSVVNRELRSLRLERALDSTLKSASEYKRQLQEQLDSSSHAIALVQEGIIVEANDAWLKRFKVEKKDEVVGMPIMDTFEAESQAALKGALVATIQGKWQQDERLATKAHIASGDVEELQLAFCRLEFDGEPCAQIRVTSAANGTGEPTKLVHDALQRDPTTLFFNRIQFLERVKKRLQSKPKSGTHCLVYIRPDKFSHVCEKVGLIDSEEIFGQFAEQVRKRLHPRDVAGRFEGTAIVALLERGHARDAQLWGSQLVEHISRLTFDVGERSTNMTCTVGAAAFRDSFTEIEDFFAATFSAYKDGIKAGGNTACLDQVTIEDTRQYEFDAIWVKRLKAAMMDNRFRLAQLPIAGLCSESVPMFDLLVRMLDEQGQSVLPSEFLPAAERSNLMKNIDRWMLHAAVHFCRNNHADRVFVRMSTQSVTDPATAVWMSQCFDENGFDCSRLVMQIPEVDAAKHIKQTRDLVQYVRKLGVGFAIEHYGVDHQRFQILDLLKPDYVKVDGELMHTLTRDRKTQDIVSRIVAAAKERNIRTIAERVENANTMAVLFQLGLDYMQGHYVHEPEVVLQETETGMNTSLTGMAAANAG